jgi:hypothetical protein
MIRIRLFESKYWPSVWRILEPELRAGETYAFSPDITETEARHAWIEAVVGVLPKAFRHCRLGYVDALVMYKQLALP